MRVGASSWVQNIGPSHIGPKMNRENRDPTHSQILKNDNASPHKIMGKYNNTLFT